MEVPGKRDEDIVHLKRHDFFCQPCDGEGQHAKAEGFCQNCQEYLCKNCCTFHRKVTVTKNHVIFDEHSMPKNKLTKQQKVVCTERCKKHTTEIIKFFCEAHDIVGCSDCITLGHKQCHVDYIPDIAEKFLKNEEHKKLLTRIDNLHADIVDEEKSSETEAEESDAACSKSIAKIRRFRQDINAYLDKNEQELINKCEHKRRENAVLTAKIREELSCLRREVSGIKSNIEIKTDNVADLFVEVKQVKSSLKQAEDSFRKTMAQGRVEMQNFTTNPDWSNILSKQISIGELSAIKKTKNISEMTPTSMGNINVRSASDKHGCLISSMVLTSSGDILCTDRSNKSVKVLDPKKQQLSSELALSSGPWDITAISNTFQFATTLPGIKKIQFVLFDGNLSELHSITTDGECRGIAYSNDTLVVSYVHARTIQAKVAVLSLRGNVLKTFDKCLYGRDVFRWPGHVVTSHNCIYVSDHDSQINSVVQLKMDGTLLATYKDPALRGVRSMTVCADGSALVCSTDSGCLLRISGDSMTIKTVLSKENGLFDPLAVCFDEPKNILYISNYFHKPHNVLVFQMADIQTEVMK